MRVPLTGATASRWIRALRTIQPSQTPITSAGTISPRTLKREYLRQGREAAPAGMVATLWDLGTIRT